MKDFFRKPKERKVYKFKDYETKHIVLVPLMYAEWAVDTLHTAHKKSIAWNPHTADKILTRYLYKHADRYYEDEGQPYLYLWLRTWWTFWREGAMPWQKTFVKKFNNKISEYLVNEFELKGFTKKVEKHPYEKNEYEIYFYKKEVK